MPEIASRKYRLAELNAVSAEEFVATVGGIFEHSPWIATAAAGERPFASAADLHAAMVRIMHASGAEKQLALIKAHPDLAGRLAKQGQLTAESTREQAAAGLTQTDTSTLARIETFNTAYRERFDFPFIICARLNNVTTIVDAMEKRLHNDRETEITTALAEIARIAQLRLADIVED